jgi:hypothetical protein
VIARVPVDEVPVLPGASRLVRTPMPALPAGKYVVLILLDYGGPDIVAGQIQLEITQ